MLEQRRLEFFDSAMWAGVASSDRGSERGMAIATVSQSRRKRAIDGE